MKTMTRMLLLGASVALAAGCSTTQFEPVAVEELHNTQGHVIGQKEVLCDCRTGERLARLSLYVPRYDDGRLVGYEEVVRGGSILRDLNGKAIGNRFVDLRSRGTNSNNRGLTVVFVQPTSARSAVAAAPSIDELLRVASISVN
jgi:hypothetical protein